MIADAGYISPIVSVPSPAEYLPTGLPLQAALVSSITRTAENSLGRRSTGRRGGVCGLLHEAWFIPHGPQRFTRVLLEDLHLGFG
jgi:hypothetical protein